MVKCTYDLHLAYFQIELYKEVCFSIEMNGLFFSK